MFVFVVAQVSVWNALTHILCRS